MKCARYDWSFGSVGDWVTLRFTVVTGAALQENGCSASLRGACSRWRWLIALRLFSTDGRFLRRCNTTVCPVTSRTSKHVTKQVSVADDHASTLIRLADSLPAHVTLTTMDGGPDRACSSVQLTAALKLPWARWLGQPPAQARLAVQLCIRAKVVSEVRTKVMSSYPYARRGDIDFCRNYCTAPDNCRHSHCQQTRRGSTAD